MELGKMETRNTYLTAVSFCLIITGFVIAVSSIKVFDIILEKLLDLTPGRMLYNEWIQTPPLMNFDVYFFNWSNPEDFLDASKKPAFTEIGPFRFDLQMERTNVTFNSFNDTITYNLKRWYKFNREESVHGLNFSVTILNQLATAAAFKAKDMNFFMQKGTSMTLLSMSSIQMTKRVGELLFEGTHDSILELFSKIPGIGNVPEKFGFFYNKNGSSDGIFNIGTGHGEHTLGTLYSWNGKNSSKFYGKSCRTLSGASMDFYPNNMKSPKIEIFNPELCRKMALDFVKKSTVHGIEGYRFEIDKSFLDNGTIIPGNECYCDDACMRYGAVPATACKGKVNNYLTLPHFLKADSFYASLVDGLEPNPKKHNFYIVVEPTTGSLLQMKAKLQMNIYVQPIAGISMFQNAPTILMPVMWFECSVKIPEEGAFKLGILLSLKGVFICIGVILAIIGILIYMLFVFELRRKSYKASEEDRYYDWREMRPLSEKQQNG